MPGANRQAFRGWWITATTVVTLGLAVGIPYYNLPFFYDYFQKAFHWELRQITFGFPLAAALTIWLGPIIIPKFSSRTLIVIGTGLTAVTLLGFGSMRGSVWVYYALYFLYTAGYLLSGPIPHQILISKWFTRQRGRAMGIMYVGVGLFGGAGSYLVRYLTAHYGFQAALSALGALILLAWPLAFFVLRDTPEEVGQHPDGDPEPSGPPVPPQTYRDLLSSRAFWLLLIGSFCSIGAIGSINTHMKFVLRDEGYSGQAMLNAAWTTASALILWSSIAGRLGIGYLADLASKKRVMVATYFVVAVAIVLLLEVKPYRTGSLSLFAVVFGFAMGADYFLIPLMAAEQFGVGSLARAMAIILPVNTIGQTWFPYGVSALRETFGSYHVAMGIVFATALAGAIAIALLPRSQATESPSRREVRVHAHS